MLGLCILYVMYYQSVNVRNEPSRDAFVEKSLRDLRGNWINVAPHILDVGAGLSPYRKLCQQLGYVYLSHDFEQYVPNPKEHGLQNDSWNYSSHDFVCDILEIQSMVSFDIILCTEVLEHVPNPVDAFRKLTQLVAPDGFIIVTVPLLSLMHQAPYWFSSGLSPFWFRYWGDQLGLEIISLEVSGDYFDLLSQEIQRSLSFLPEKFKVGIMLGNLFRMLRRFAKSDLRGSGGFGTFLLAQKRRSA